MAANGGEEIDYESDPDEAKRSLAMRRREASDDEEGESDRYDRPRMSGRAIVPSVESDGEDGAGVYYDEDDEEYESLGDEGEVYEDYEDEDENNHRVSVDEGRVEAIVNGERGGVNKMVVNSKVMESDEGIGRNVEGEDEKVVEPFSVPTAGAFYMHDDRFRPMDGSGGRHRRGRGARMLWESRDNGRWGHDKFEELNQKKEYEERRRNSRGRFRGLGRPRGADGGHDHSFDRRSSAIPSGKNQGQAEAAKRVGRGRGPMKYERVRRNSRETPKQYKQSWNPVEKTSLAESKTIPALPTKAGTAQVPPKKQIVASSLSYASPPFYPSGSTGNLTHKRDVQSGSISRNLPSSLGSLSLKGKNKVDSIGMDIPNIKDGSAGSLGNMQSSPTVSSSKQLWSSVQSWVPQSFKAPNQQSVSSSLDISLMNQKTEYASEQGKPNSSTLKANGKGARPVNGVGPSVFYGGTQFIGASGNATVGQGDQNFPALLPVMRFGGQHPGGIGLQPVGMAFPGYVGSPQSGIANSEMTWLPVLAGAGAFGSMYHPPYPTADGSYHALPSGLPSSASASSKENGANMANSEPDPVQKPEAVNNETTPQQNNPDRQPRRYSKMSFGK